MTTTTTPKFEIGQLIWNGQKFSTITGVFWDEASGEFSYTLEGFVHTFAESELCAH